MKIKLNQWQSLLLFIPLVTGSIIGSLPQHNLHSNQTYFAIANLLLILTICLLFSYQAYLAIVFDKLNSKGSTIFKVNTLIPVVFFWMYLCYVSYTTFIKDDFHNPKFIPGPIRTTNMHWGDWVVLILLIYGLINFLFINNQYVLSRIKQQKDVDRQEYLQLNYWLPMRKFVRTSAWFFAGSIILSVIVDIITLLTI